MTLGNSKAPTLETEQLRLRAHTIDDFPACSTMWADPDVVKHISGRAFSPEESWSRLLRYAGHWQLLGFGYWAVEKRPGSKFIGEVGLADFQRELTPSQGDSPEAGWVITPPEHGKGYATEAMRCVLAWADANLQQRNTFCIVSPEHSASINVADKLGYADRITGSYRDESVVILSRPRVNV